MTYGTAPTHWYLHKCDFCFKDTFISIEDEWDTEDRFCPNCGISSEVIADDYDEDNINYEQDYEE